MSGVCYPYEVQSIYSQFYEAEILDEIKASLHEILHVMGSHDSTSEDVLHQNEQLVKDVKLYITEHYPDFNLSLSTITARTAQEFADKIANLLAGGVQQKGKHPFAEYAWNWFNTYSGGFSIGLSAGWYGSTSIKIISGYFCFARFTAVAAI